MQDVLNREEGADSAQEMQTPAGESACVTSVSFDRSGGALLTSESTGKVSIFDVEVGKRMRSWSWVRRIGRSAACKIVSYCRSVLTPYLVAVGEESMIGLYDVRARDPAVMKIGGHTGTVCGLSWSVNQSSEMMRRGDADCVRLASGCSDGTIGVWGLRELLQASRGGIAEPSIARLWSQESHEAPA